MNYTIDETMVVCMSHQIKNGSIVAQGLATPLVAAAYLLARYTHAPDLYFMSAIGQGICNKPTRLSISNIESLWLRQSLCNVGFVRAAADVLPSLKPIEFFRPAQVDRFGNFNNVAFGKNYLIQDIKTPRMRLPGTGGIPDVSTFISDIMLYVPRHSRITFVNKIDVVSGMGYHDDRCRGSGPKYLISDLGEFKFNNGMMYLSSYHNHTNIEQIQSRTGFELIVPKEVKETSPPTSDELSILRELIDPLRIRKLELLSGFERRKLLQQILEKESHFYG